MPYDRSLKNASRLNQTFPIQTIFLIFFLLGSIGLIYNDSGAQVQVIPEEPEFLDVTLKLAGASCDVNAAESAVLHLRGVVSVDIEAKKDHLLVAYDPAKVSPQLMVEAIGRKRGCNANIVGGGRP